MGEEYHIKKTVYLCDCIGKVHFAIYEQINLHEWMLISKSSKSSYGFDPDFNYKMKSVNDKNAIILTNKVGEYNQFRRPNHSSYDNYMIYWVLEGKECQDMAGWLDRVRVM